MMQIRTMLIAVLFFTTTSGLFGQSRAKMVGVYKHAVFMYSCTLKLNDTENYELIESSDRGSQRTIGTWTIRGQAIRLTAKKKINVDVYKKQTESVIKDSAEEVVVIETTDVLVFLSKDFKMQRSKS